MTRSTAFLAACLMTLAVATAVPACGGGSSAQTPVGQQSRTIDVAHDLIGCGIPTGWDYDSTHVDAMIDGVQADRVLTVPVSSDERRERVQGRPGARAAGSPRNASMCSAPFQ